MEKYIIAGEYVKRNYQEAGNAGQIVERNRQFNKNYVMDETFFKFESYIENIYHKKYSNIIYEDYLHTINFECKYSYKKRTYETFFYVTKRGKENFIKIYFDGYMDEKNSLVFQHKSFEAAHRLFYMILNLININKLDLNIYAYDDIKMFLFKKQKFAKVFKYNILKKINIYEMNLNLMFKKDVMSFIFNY